MATRLDHGAVNSFLRGPRYPISRDELVHLAEVNRVPAELIQALRGLPPGEYGSREDVMDHLKAAGNDVA